MKYILGEELHVEEKNGRFLVVSSTPPSWIIVNNDGLEVIKSIPVGSLFNVDDLCKILRLKPKSLISDFLEDLHEACILATEGEKIIQPNRQPRIRGAYIELTNKCNLNCSHCYVSASSTSSVDVLTKSDIIGAIKQVPVGGEIGFSGGEPLLRVDCLEIISEAVRLGYQCSLLTNGLLVTEEIAKKLASLGVTVQVSLDGSNAFEHEKIRGEDTFEKTIASIQLLLKYSKRVRVSFTPTKFNYKSFGKFISLVTDIGVPSVHICTYSMQGRGKTNKSELMISVMDLLNLQTEIESYSNSIEIMGNLPETLDIGRYGYLWDKCPIGGSIRIGFDGNIYPCEIASHKDLVMGNIKNSSLLDALNSIDGKKLVKHSRERINLIEKCASCVWRHFCGGGCFVLSLAEHDHKLETDYLCELRQVWFSKLLWGNVQNEQ